MNETRMQQFKKVADDIISQGAQVSFTKEHFIKDYSWVNPGLGAQEKLDSDYYGFSESWDDPDIGTQEKNDADNVSEAQDARYRPEKDSNYSKKEEKTPNLFKHFFHCVCQHPGQVVLYEGGKCVSWIGHFLSAFVRFSILLAVLKVLIGMYNNNSGKQIAEFVVNSFKIGFCLTILLFCFAIIYAQFFNSKTLLVKVFHYRTVAPLWFTIWNKEEGRFIPYDYWFDPLDNTIDDSLNDGLSLVTDYSQDQLQSAYSKLSALEKFLIIPDTYSRRVFYPEPLTEIDQAELDYDNKREEVRLSLYKKMKEDQTNFLSQSVPTIVTAGDKDEV